MSIIVPAKFHTKIFRPIVYLIAKYLTHKLDITEYMIGGSYRRKKWFSNDIDLLVPEHHMSTIKPKMKKLGFFVNTLRSEHCLSVQFMKKIKFFNKIKYLVVDVMPYTKDNKGNVLVFATGSAQHNDCIRKMLKQKNITWENPRVFKDLANNTKVSFDTEEKVYNYLDIVYIKPKDR